MSGPAGDINSNGDFDFRSFFMEIPPVTRTLFVTMFSGTLLSGLGLLPNDLFMLEWLTVIHKLQVWRLVFTFCHLGKLGLAFLIHMYFLYTYSRQLEMGTFFGRPANYAWFLTFVSIFVLLGSTVFTTLVNGGALLIAIVHLWGRHADNVTVTMYGFIQIPAKYLSLTFLFLDLVISGSFSIADLLGLLGGHLFYFLDSVYPGMPGGKQLIFVPLWFERFIDQLQAFLGSVTGLHSTPPAPRTGYRPSTISGGRLSGMPRASGPLPDGATTSARSGGFTAPSFRFGHNWGTGHTLGSS